MGADIYLNSVYEAQMAVWRPKFEAAVAARDKVIKQVGGSQLVERDPRVKARVDDLQAKVSEIYDKMGEAGYFRDSYNDTSLFWVLNLSWWELAKKLCDENGDLPIENARLHLEVMEAAREDFDRLFKAWVAKKRTRHTRYEGGPVEKPWTFKQKGGQVEDWRDMLSKKLDDWIALLKQSIELNEPLHWSV